MLKTRFAPTPSGYLHIGNAFSFVLTWLVARKMRGHIYLRIDDIDAERCRKTYVEDVFQTLDWLGLNYDSGAQSVDDFYTNYSQQLRLDHYQQVLNQLRDQGLLFACTCSRKQVNGLYQGTCLDTQHSFDKEHTNWRIKTTSSTISFLDQWSNKNQDIALHQVMPYFVLRNKRNRAAYQLVSVIEDIEHDINFIVRGQDLLYSTAAQLFLAKQVEAYQNFQQIQWLHHPLLKDDSGLKLSKSKGAAALKTWRENNQSKETIFKLVSLQLGLGEVGNLSELLDAFTYPF